MAEPVRRRLRPARRSGLTSPDRSAPATAPTATEPRPRARNPGQAAGQASGRTPAPGFTPENSSCRNRSRKRPTGIGRWIEAKCGNSDSRKHSRRSTDQRKLQKVQYQLELMKEVVAQLPQIKVSAPTSPTVDRLTAEEGAGLRALRALLLAEDRSRIFGDLRKVGTESGEIVWLCPRHEEVLRTS